MKFLLSALILTIFVNGQSNPCEDERYLKIKEKSLDDMSDREYDYFLSAEKKCKEFSSSAASVTPSVSSTNNDYKQNNTMISADENSIGINKKPGQNNKQLFVMSLYGGMDILGEFTQEVEGQNSVTEKMANAPSFGVDFMSTKMNNGLVFGVGFEMQLERNYDDNDLEDVGKLSFMSPYLALHYYNVQNMNSYGILRIGQSIQNFDDDFAGDWNFNNGLYLAAGGGFKMSVISLELIWSYNYGDANLDFMGTTYKNDFEFQKLSISGKYNFPLEQ